MKVYVAVLTIGSIRKELSLTLSRLSKDNRVKIVFHSERPSERNRNQVVKDFLNSDCDYLLKIDHDTVPLRNPLGLIDLDKDIIGLPYPQIKGNDLGWLVMDKVKDGYKQTKKPRKGLQEVDAVGSGCVLIHRRVLERVEEPFVRKWKDGFPILGLDFYFCEKAKKAGFEVWTHWDYPCSHYKEVDLVWILKLLGEQDGR